MRDARGGGYDDDVIHTTTYYYFYDMYVRGGAIKIF